MDIKGFPAFEIVQPEDVNGFYQSCLEHYRDNIEDANLLLSIAYKMTVTCKESDERYILKDKESGKVLLIAVRNKPLNVVFGPSERDEYVIALARYFGKRYEEEKYELPGIVSSTSLGKVFMEEYFRIVQNIEVKLWKGQQLHVLRKYQPAEDVGEGMMVLANESERKFLIAWMQQFWRDVGFGEQETSRSFVEGMVDHRLSEKAVFLWKVPSPNDPTILLPVSMLMKALCTESMYRIACVYTPAEYRGHHYATLLTSTLTHQIVIEGGHRCILFTDEQNPISNHIYEKIGYRIVAHHSNVSFQRKFTV